MDKWKEVIYAINCVSSLIFAVLLLVYVKTETESKIRPWTKYLGIAFSILAVQYFILLCNIPELLNMNEYVNNIYSIIFSELLGFFISLFLVKTANCFYLENKLKIFSIRNVFFYTFIVLSFFELMAVCITIYGLPNTKVDSTDVIPTLCRICGGLLSLLSISYLSYTTYINSKFYKNKKKSLLFVAFLFIYAFIQLFPALSPDIINPDIINYLCNSTTISYWVNPDINKRDDYIKDARLINKSAAIPLKILLFLFAFRIITLETQSLIQFRRTLRESVEKRKVFFSGDGLLVAIYNIFSPQKIRLFTIVPVKDKYDLIVNKTHMFEYSAKGRSISEYEIIEIEDSPLNNILCNIPLDEVHENQLIKPIYYHGAIIGCLQIENKENQKFNYSGERILNIFSEDISPLLQFYRLQETSFLLSSALKLKAESDIQILKSWAYLVKRLEAVTKQILSPVSLNLSINSIFIRKELLKNGVKKILSKNVHKYFECSVSKEDEGFSLISEAPKENIVRNSIGLLSIEFLTIKDPIDQPSLGYYNTFGKSVATTITDCYLELIGKRLDLVIKNLSLELAKRRTYDTWIETIEENLKENSIDEVVAFHPIRQEYWTNPKNKNCFLQTSKLPSVESVFSKFEIPERAISENKVRIIEINDTHIIIGLYLPLIELKDTLKSFLLVSISREKLPEELELDRKKYQVQLEDIKFNAKWERFFDNLSGIADKSLARVVQAYQIQQLQDDLAAKMISEKTGMVAHEIINTVLNLRATVSLIDRKLEKAFGSQENKSSFSDLVQELKESTVNLSELVEGIRFSPKTQESSTNTNLVESVQKSIELYSGRLEGLSINAQNLVDVRINLSQEIVELIFANLLSNAIAAIKTSVDSKEIERMNAKIEIWSEEDKNSNFINCFIKDNGTGINTDDKDRIFNIDFSTKNSGGGWGLFFTRRVLEKLGCSIELFHSEKGNTIFKVHLPKDKNQNV